MSVAPAVWGPLVQICMGLRFHFKQNVWENLCLIILTSQQPVSNKIISQINLHQSPTQLISFWEWPASCMPCNLLICLPAACCVLDQPTYQLRAACSIGLPISCVLRAQSTCLLAVCCAINQPIYQLCTCLNAAQMLVRMPLKCQSKCWSECCSNASQNAA